MFFQALDLEAELSERSDESQYLAVQDELGRLLRLVEDVIAGPGQEMGRAYFVRGLVLRVSGRYRDVEFSFRTANELDPGQVDTLRELVLCLGQQGRDADALPFARKAVEVAPEDAGAWGNLAVSLARIGERAEGWVAIQRALDLDPTDAINRRVLDRFDSL
jgi:tetratricopeptide (TPR) repeat protein